jgi:ABC-type glycerol-3-phosphate transport system permease component
VRYVDRKALRHDGPRVAALLVLALLTFFPFVFMLTTSFKDNEQFFHSYVEPTFPLHPENYLSAWIAVSPYLTNSLLVTAATSAAVVTLSCLSAFVFARHAFPGKELLYYAVISLLMVPWILTLVPQFIIVRDLKMLNTYWGYVLPYTSGGQVFAIFVLRNFFQALPEEIFEAARIDGASEWRILRSVVVPLSYPILVTIVILETLGVWNDIIWSTIVATQDQVRTVPAGLVTFTQASQTLYGPLFAGYVLASLPLIVLFVFTMRQFVAGLTSGALKG